MRREPRYGSGEGAVHALSRRAIDEAVRERTPGTFALGYWDGAEFRAFFVGRSDTDLHADLQAWVEAPSQPRRHPPSVFAPWQAPTGPQTHLGTRALGPIPIGADTAYTHFTFRYAPSALAAFEREREDYHALGGGAQLDNARPPEPPRMEGRA